MENFECIKENANGGGVVLLKVLCNPIFAGTAITAKGGQTLLSETCPQTSPHEVKFYIPHVGKWTVSAEHNGKSYTLEVDVYDNTINMNMYIGPMI